MDTHLLSALSQYGYALLEPERMPNPNALLAELSKKGDARLLEGFPVVLANALEKRRSEVDLTAVERELPDEAGRQRFRKLTGLSFHLFELFGLEELKPAGYEAEPFKNMPPGLDLESAKKTFLRYYVRGHDVEAGENKARLREEFQREYNLSLFFAPRQRDLLQKKLRGEPLTKTEREYFSRVVRKKLSALVDPDLHRLAQRALQ